MGIGGAPNEATGSERGNHLTSSGTSFRQTSELDISGGFSESTIVKLKGEFVIFLEA